MRRRLYLTTIGGISTTLAGCTGFLGNSGNQYDLEGKISKMESSDKYQGKGAEGNFGEYKLDFSAEVENFSEEELILKIKYCNIYTDGGNEMGDTNLIYEPTIVLSAGKTKTIETTAEFYEEYDRDNIGSFELLVEEDS